MKKTILTIAICLLVSVGYAQKKATAYIKNPYIIANNELTEKNDIIQRYNQINSVDAKPNPYFKARMDDCSYYTIKYKHKIGVLQIFPDREYRPDIKERIISGARFKAHGSEHSGIKGYPGLHLETYKQGDNDVVLYFVSRKDTDNGISIDISNPTLNKWLSVSIWINLNNADKIKLAKDFIKKTQFK